MRLRQIEVLHALLSAGSVSGAARLLHVTQPAVSKVLAHTEQQLRLRLFERHRGRLAPTQEALALWGEIEKVVPQVEAVRRLAENLRSGDGQTLRVATLPSLAQSLLPAALAALARNRAELAIELRAQHTQELVPALTLRDADLAFDFGAPAHPAIRRTRVLATQLVCVAPRGWFEPARVLGARELARHARIGMAPSDPLHQRLVAARSPFAPHAPARLTAQTFHAALALAAEGAGWALVDSFTALGSRAGAISVHRLRPAFALHLESLAPAERPPGNAARELTAAVATAAGEMLRGLAPPRAARASA